MAKQIYTIGHSTRKIEYFIDLLKSFDIKILVDVRTIPKSRHNPQFDQINLKQVLKKTGIKYIHLKKLGGLHHTTKDSINLGWENLSFRGYADYMQKPEFWKGIQRLEEIASHERCAIMCAEAIPWRCHRSLIADALKKSRWKVYHIQSRITAKLHQYTPFLRFKKGDLFYPKQN